MSFPVALFHVPVGLFLVNLPFALLESFPS